MVVTYALEPRHHGFVLALAVGCLLSSVYGFLAGTWPFGVVEIVWAGIAVRRFFTVRGAATVGARFPPQHTTLTLNRNRRPTTSGPKPLCASGRCDTRRREQNSRGA